MYLHVWTYIVCFFFNNIYHHHNSSKHSFWSVIISLTWASDFVLTWGKGKLIDWNFQSLSQVPTPICCLCPISKEQRPQGLSPGSCLRPGSVQNRAYLCAFDIRERSDTVNKLWSSKIQKFIQNNVVPNFISPFCYFYFYACCSCVPINRNIHKNDFKLTQKASVINVLFINFLVKYNTKEKFQL
jgi:hypothetical protein